MVATLPGRSERRIFVSGHYDTVARIEASDPASGGGGGGSGSSWRGWRVSAQLSQGRDGPDAGLEEVCVTRVLCCVLRSLRLPTPGPPRDPTYSVF